MGDSVQKSRREVWSQEALSALRRAVEAQPGGDSDVDWAEVAQKLGCTVERARLIEVEQNQEHWRGKRAAVCAAPVCAAPAVVWYEPPQPEG